MRKLATVASLVESYLAARRSAGFDLREAGSQLRAFARFANQRRHRGPITRSLALDWAQSSKHGRPITAARRVEVLRPFMKHCVALGCASETLPPGVCGPAHRRLTPHIYTDSEIRDLLEAAMRLPPTGGLRPLCYKTLFGLLAVTAMRISEALGLESADVDLDQGLLTIRKTKFRKSRVVPIDRTTASALRGYQEVRQQHAVATGCPAFFVSAIGKPLPSRTVHDVFRRLRDELGWHSRGSHPHPRLHDLRHTFICRALVRSQQNAVPADRVVDTIATYVGHAKVSDTYWYLSAIPELLGAAADRFAPSTGGER